MQLAHWRRVLPYWRRPRGAQQRFHLQQPCAFIPQREHGKQSHGDDHGAHGHDGPQRRKSTWRLQGQGLGPRNHALDDTRNHHCKEQLICVRDEAEGNCVEQEVIEFNGVHQPQRAKDDQHGQNRHLGNDNHQHPNKPRRRKADDRKVFDPRLDQKALRLSACKLHKRHAHVHEVSETVGDGARPEHKYHCADNGAPREARNHFHEVLMNHHSGVELQKTGGQRKIRLAHTLLLELRSVCSPVLQTCQIGPAITIVFAPQAHDCGTQDRLQEDVDDESQNKQQLDREREAQHTKKDASIPNGKFQCIGVACCHSAELATPHRRRPIRCLPRLGRVVASVRAHRLMLTNFNDRHRAVSCAFVHTWADHLWLVHQVHCVLFAVFHPRVRPKIRRLVHLTSRQLHDVNGNHMFHVLLLMRQTLQVVSQRTFQLRSAMRNSSDQRGR
mmetsp:Transcript_12420/g.34197  ORF Transcript_12420/g.34197 Transcript_12420/m.34197 type:complete len:443 (+) Transcript_12420:96-1424(+)